MNWRLLGLGFVCVTLAFDIASAVASDAATEHSRRDQSPLNDPNDRTIVSSIDRMKHRLSEGQITDRILVNLRIFEFGPEELSKYVTRSSNWDRYRWSTWFDPESPEFTVRLMSYGLWDAVELQQLTHHPEAPSWSSPPIALVSGREAHFKLGETIPAPRMADDGVSQPLDEFYGRSIVATATINNLNRIHLVVASEVSDQTTSNGIASVGNKRRLDAVFDMNHGETRALGRKVISTSGTETHQVMLATAWLKPFEIPLDPETIPVSAVDELSTPEKYLAEFNATCTPQGDVAARIDTMSLPVPSLQPGNQPADDSEFARRMRRIPRNELADEVRLSVVVTEVTRAQIGKNFGPFRSYHGFYTWEPNLFSTFPSDVIEVETQGDSSTSDLKTTDLLRLPSGMRAFRPNRLQMHTVSKTWKLPTALAESGKTIQWQSGGEVPVVRLNQYRHESIANEQFGVTVTARPTITDIDETDLQLHIALKDLMRGAKSLRVESARRMRTSIRVRNGEIVTFGQPAVSDTGRESFLTVSVTANTLAPHQEPSERDIEIASALFPENSNSTQDPIPVNANFATLFGAGRHQGCWADSIPLQSQDINDVLETLECHRSLPPDAQMSQLSYRLTHPFDESSPLITDP